MAQPTLNLSHETIEGDGEVLVTAQLRFVPVAVITPDEQAKIFQALNPVLAAVAEHGTVLAISLSIQPYTEEDEDADQAG